MQMQIHMHSTDMRHAKLLQAGINRGETEAGGWSLTLKEKHSSRLTIAAIDHDTFP